MPNFEFWKDVLSRQTVFSSLSESLIEQLLREEVSKEQNYPPGREIIKRGESGDTCFVIGSGSVQVVVPENGGEATLSVLRQGELFGEMAIFEKKPRAATVRANENCRLLEIGGQEFLKVLREHTHVALEVLLGISERLRHADEQVTALKMKDMDGKLRQFKAELAVEVKGVSASLKEAQALVGHTKSRADDIIGSFERTRTWLTWMAYFVIGIITIGGVGGGVGGFYYLEDLYDRAEDTLTNLNNSTVRVYKLEEDLVETVLIPQFRRAVKEEEKATRVAVYENLVVFEHSGKFRLVLNVIEMEIERQIEEKVKPRIEYSEVLQQILNAAQKAEKHTEVAKAYYLFLTNQILVKDETSLNGEEFASTFSDFKAYVSNNKDIDWDLLPDFKELFANESQEKKKKFKEVANVLPIL